MNATPTRGPIIPIGGAADADLIRQVIDVAGGSRGHVVAITTASRDPKGEADRYAEIFRSLGVTRYTGLPIKNQKQANSRDARECVLKATWAFFTGGDQARLGRILGGTEVLGTLKELNGKGMPVAGTSAGAAVMARRMILCGDPGELHVGQIPMGPGFGLIPYAYVDQHFS